MLFNVVQVACPGRQIVCQPRQTKTSGTTTMVMKTTKGMGTWLEIFLKEKRKNITSDVGSHIEGQPSN